MKGIYEPMKKERFLMTLSEEFTIRGWWVVLLSHSSGLLFNSDMVKNELINGYTNVKLKISETINIKMAHQLIEMCCGKQLFDFTLESIDPTGLTTNKWKLVDARIRNIHFGDSDGFGFVDNEIIIVPNGFTLLK